MTLVYPRFHSSSTYIQGFLLLLWILALLNCTQLWTFIKSMQFGKVPLQFLKLTWSPTKTSSPTPQKKLLFFSPNLHFGKDKDATKLHMFWSNKNNKVLLKTSVVSLTKFQAPSRLKCSPKDCCYPRNVEHQNHLATVVADWTIGDRWILGVPMNDLWLIGKSNM